MSRHRHTKNQPKTLFEGTKQKSYGNEKGLEPDQQKTGREKNEVEEKRKRMVLFHTGFRKYHAAERWHKKGPENPKEARETEINDLFPNTAGGRVDS